MARIAIISDGQGVHALRSIEALLELGHEVDWIPTRPPSSDTGARLHPGLRPVGSSPLAGMAHLIGNAAFVRRKLRQLKPDLVQAHFLTPCGWYAYASGFRPYTVHLWGSDILSHRSQPPHYRLFSSRTLGYAASVTADSANLIRLAQDVAPHLRAGPVLSWGVDTRIFRYPEPDERNRIRRSLGLLKPFVFLSTRNFKPQMNVPSLIKAFAALPPEILSNSTLILKKGFPMEASSADVQAAIHECGLVEHVLLIEEEWSYLDMLSLYQSANVFVSIPESGTDGLSQSLLDAIACGCVPIVSRNDATEELIGPGRVEGFVVDGPRIPGELTAALELGMRRAVWNSEGFRLFNQEYIRVNFDRSLCVSKLQEHLGSLIGGEVRTRPVVTSC